MDIHVTGNVTDDFTNKTSSYLISASYLTDAIYDIIQRVSSLITNASETVIVIQSEPNECRIRMKRNDLDCTFEIFEFEDNFSSDEIDNGTCVFKSQLKLKVLIKKFVSEINKLHDLDPKEYQRRWGYEFPVEAYDRLMKAWKMLKNS